VTVRLPKSFGGPARHKYNAVRTHLDGIAFASKAEAQYYGQLLIRQKAGEVRNIKLQPHFALMVPVLERAVENVNAGVYRGVAPLGEYHADFSFEERHVAGWRFVVVDVKGVDVRFNKWKRTHAERQYGFTVRVVRNERRSTRQRRDEWQSALQKRSGRSATGTSKQNSRTKSASS
jgi:hypothetical protein